MWMGRDGRIAGTAAGWAMLCVWRTHELPDALDWEGVTVSESAGLILIILGGVMEGAFGAFMKKTPNWNWENIWGAGSLLALLLIPWSVALATIPGLWEVYDSSPPK